jgi:23S rRNA (guanosine2251-2'-O)-methyltransferase
MQDAGMKNKHHRSGDRPAPDTHRKAGRGADQKSSHKGARKSDQKSDQRSGAARPHRDGQNRDGQSRDGQNRGGQASRPASALSPKAKDGYFLFGRHAVEAALANPARECVRLVGTKRALPGVPISALRPNVPIEALEDDTPIRSTVPADAPHQGLLLEVRPLPGTDILDLAPVAGQRNILLMLDQVTDPHNVGACLRSASALGARALITQDRNSPSESGTLARASSGGLETLPWARVANLAQALETLRDMGYWHVGLDGQTDTSLRPIVMGDNIVIVMGSEGRGLRPLVRKHCDAVAKIPMTGRVESLNVSNAAAIALYELGRP